MVHNAAVAVDFCSIADLDVKAVEIALFPGAYVQSTLVVAGI